jgi:hypothetical protein
MNVAASCLRSRDWLDVLPAASGGCAGNSDVGWLDYCGWLAGRNAYRLKS